MEAKTYAEMRKLSREDLIRNLDQILGSHGPIADIEFIREEIWHRDAEQLNQRMERMTNQIRWITVFIAFLTIGNVGMIVYNVMSR